MLALVSTVTTAPRVPATPIEKLASRITPIWWPAGNVYSVGRIGNLNSYFWPGVDGRPGREERVAVGRVQDALGDAPRRDGLRGLGDLECSSALSAGGRVAEAALDGRAGVGDAVAAAAAGRGDARAVVDEERARGCSACVLSDACRSMIGVPERCRSVLSFGVRNDEPVGLRAVRRVDGVGLGQAVVGEREACRCRRPRLRQQRAGLPAPRPLRKTSVGVVFGIGQSAYVCERVRRTSRCPPAARS